MHLTPGHSHPLKKELSQWRPALRRVEGEPEATGKQELEPPATRALWDFFNFCHFPTLSPPIPTLLLRRAANQPLTAGDAGLGLRDLQRQEPKEGSTRQRPVQPRGRDSH